MKILTTLISFSLALHVTAKKPNILFIAIDDLRPELGCYGSELVKSPNLDALAATGLRFDRAYCQETICAPSRASLLSGTRPDTNGITHNFVEFRDLNPNLLTLPEHFIQQGYETAFTGKIYHRDQDQKSWSRQPARKKLKVEKPRGPFALPENRELRKKNFDEMFKKYGEAAKRGLASGPAYESADVPDHTYIDGYNTVLAIETVKEMAADPEKPFFMALGFKLPHLNWVAPKKYWDMYDREKIPLATQTEGPKGGAEMGLHASFELRTRAGIPKHGPIDDDLARTLRHAYFASVSYVDAQIGMMLKMLDEEGLRDNTIIVVWGDHGWHLGEMGIWGKATNYEIAARVPLIVSTPWMKAKGQSSEALVELLDIYPTLCDLAGITKPDHIEGKSFAPLLDQPRMKWKDGAVTQFPSPALREWAANPLSPEMRETFFGPLIEEVEARIVKQQGEKWDRELFEQHLMGYTIRTKDYRLILWKDQRNPKAQPIFEELFDHRTDPLESVNIAAQNPELVKALSMKMDHILKK
ncbi:MAG: sulfatase [Akkermansiaceae bacterium]